MGGLGVGLLLVASIAVHVDSTRQVDEADRAFLVSQFQDAVERATTVRPVVDTPPPGGCASPDRCVADVRQRTGAKIVLFLQLIGAPSRIRLTVDRDPPADGAAGRAQVDLTRDRASWGPPIDGVAVTLFGDAAKFRAPPPPPPPVATAPTAPPELIADSPAPADEGSMLVAGWTLIGVGVVLGGVATALGVVSQNATDEFEMNKNRPSDEIDDLESRKQATGWSANIGWGLGGASVVTGIILLATD